MCLFISYPRKVFERQYSRYFTESKVVGYIKHNHDRDACDIIIDGKPYAWAELEKNISAREGFKIKIEFGDVGDDLDEEKYTTYDADNVKH